MTRTRVQHGSLAVLALLLSLSCSDETPSQVQRALGGEGGGGGDMDAGMDAGSDPPTEVLLASEDTYVQWSSAENTNFSTSTVLRVGAYSVDAPRPLVRFNNAALIDLIDGRRVVSARLVFQVVSNSANFYGTDRPLEAHRLSLASDYATATWKCTSDTNLSNSAPDCGWGGPPEWHMHHAAGWPFIKIATGTTHVDSTTSGRVDIDVTSDVRAFALGLADNHGWLIKLDPWAEYETGQIEFASLEATNSALRPRLELYLSNDPPGTPCVLQGFDTTCDNVDDDCDSTLDEAFVPTLTTCGGEVCTSTGMTSCVDHVIEDSCTPAAPCASTPEEVVGVVGDTFGSDWEHEDWAHQNFGTDARINIGRGLVFIDEEDLSDAVDGRTVRLATLDLTTKGFNWQWKPERTLEAHRLVVPSGELLATGACPIDTNLSNNTRDCAWNESWQWSAYGWDTTESASHPATDGTWGTIHLDLTADIQAILDEENPNYGWILFEADEQVGEIDFYSREGDAARGPRISLWFEDESCTPIGADTNCDSVDDDCDGTADDNYTGTSTSCGEGYCTATSTTVCEDGTVVDPCTPPSNCYEPIGDACDDDSDCALLGAGHRCLTDESSGLLGGYCTAFCDGETPCPEDSFCTGETCVALCDGTDCTLSRHECVDIGYEDSVCIPICETHAQCGEGRRCTAYHCVAPGCAEDDTTCDGFDDDCDETLDEDYEPIGTTCGLGVCASTGVTSCVGASVHDSCEAAEPEGDDDDCDDIDDDCDGDVDEGYPQEPTNCGVGACADEGVLGCVSGEVVDTCTAGTPATETSTCDDIDNDCDSWTDETVGIGTCDNIRFRIQPTQGGVISLSQGGATITRASTTCGLDAAINAIHYPSPSLLTRWCSVASTGGYFVVSLAPSLQVLDRVVLTSAQSNAYVQDFQVYGSATVDEDSAYRLLLSGTLASTATPQTFRLPAVPVRFLKFVAVSNYGNAVNTYLTRLNAYSDAFGSATVSLTDETVISGATIVSRTWDFGDGSTSTAASPSHTYAAPGDYTITLTSIDSLSATHVRARPYRVLVAPSAAFTTSPSPPVEGTAATWVSQAQAASGHSILSDLFVMTSINYAPGGQFTVPNHGTEAVTHTVVDSQLLTTALNQNVTIADATQTVDAGPDLYGVWGEPVRFGDYLVHDNGAADNTGMTCTWSFGDGATATVTDCAHSSVSFREVEAHSYAEPGVYTATLTATTPSSVVVSDTRTVVIDRRQLQLVVAGIVGTDEAGEFELSVQVYDPRTPSTALVSYPIDIELAGVTESLSTDSTGRITTTIVVPSGSTAELNLSFDGNDYYDPAFQSDDLSANLDGDAPTQLIDVLEYAGYRYLLGFPQSGGNRDTTSLFANTSDPLDDLEVYLATTADTTARIRALDGSFEVDVPVMVEDGARVRLPSSLRLGPVGSNHTAGESAWLEEKAVEVTAPVPIVVTAVDAIIHQTDAYRALPAEDLGYEYIVAAYPNQGVPIAMFGDPGTGNGTTQIAVTADQDDTHITVVPADDVSPGPSLPNGAPRGVPFSMTLQRGQTVQLINENSRSTADDWEDLSGSRVFSDKPIAVYGGSVCAYVTLSACNHLIEQMPPVDTLGTVFLVSAYGRRLGGALVRVLAAHDNTEVIVGGVIEANLDVGETYTFNLMQAEHTYVLTSQPALVTQLSKGTDSDLQSGDPFLEVVVPTEHYSGRQLLSTPHARTRYDSRGVAHTYGFRHMIGITALTSTLGGIRIDGEPITSGWTVFGDLPIASTEVEVEEGPHLVTHLDPSVIFGTRIYGFPKTNLLDPYGSDAYGTTGPIRLPRHTCRPTRPIAGDGIDNDCDGVADEERDDDVDDDGDGYLNEDTFAVAPTTNLAPEAQATMVVERIGTQTIRFALPGYDANGDVLTFQITQQPSLGTATLSGNVVTFSATSPVTTTLRYTVSDGALSSSEGVVNIVPLPVGGNGAGNEAPIQVGPAVFSLAIPAGQTTATLRVRVGAIDPELEAISFTLTSAPTGMAIDASSGEITWTATLSQVGNHLATGALIDASGASRQWAIQALVSASSTNNAPSITSTAVTIGALGTAYSYQVAATDPDSDTLTYLLGVAPTGMSLSSSGLLTWTPQYNQGGQHQVEVAVRDSQNAWDYQSFVIDVPIPGSTLAITSTPSYAGVRYRPWRYQVQVTDGNPSGGAISYVLRATPGGISLTQDGLLQWNEPTPGKHAISIEARNSQGDIAVQTFAVEVQEHNFDPVFVSDPQRTGTIGLTYRYDADALDSGPREILTYGLVDPPIDMTIDARTGVISWTPASSGSFPVTITATDPLGAVATQTYVIEVTTDEIEPIVLLDASPRLVAVNAPSLITTSIADNVAVTSLVVTLDGTPITLDSEGTYTFSSSVVGAHYIVATVTDAASNTTTATLSIGVEDSSDTDAPEVALDLDDTEKLTFLHEVTGSVEDENLLGYELSLLAVGRPEDERVVIAESNAVPGTDPLGIIDATQLRNGYYTLRLEAEDANGEVGSVERPIEIEGQAKVGTVAFSAVDMVLPTAGITLAAVRSYDSRDQRVGDFGVGWRLDVKQGSVQSNRKVGEHYALFSYDTGGSGFEAPCQRDNEQRPHYTLVRLSDSEWYVFRPVLANATAISGACHAEVTYEQVDGTTDGAMLWIDGPIEVRASPSYLQPLEALPISMPVNLVDPTTLEVYDPQSFVLELADGREFNINTATGITLIQAPNGDNVSIGAGGMVSSTGGQLLFDRDSAGRIRRITGPGSRIVNYQYNTLGDLRVVTDLLGKQTRFEYDTTHLHHITRVLDATGSVVGNLRYDSDGRLSEACDPLGACTRTLHNLDTRTETVLDALAHQTSYTYDVRGNVLSQTDPLSNTTTFEYDEDDNVVRAEGPDGSVATYDYDDKRMTQRVLPYEVGEDPADFTYDYGYDAAGNRDSVTLPSGASFAFAFDAARLTSVEDGDENVIESRTYGAGMMPTAVTNRFGTTSSITTSSAGTIASYTSEFGNAVTVGTDSLGAVTSRTEHGKTINITRDNASRPTRYNFGDGKTVDVSYGGTTNEWTSLYGPTIGRIERTLNRRGQLTRWVDPNGDVHQRYYDGAGRVIREVNPLGNETAYTYDDAGRLETITDDALDATTTFERDDAGRVTKVIDPLGNETETTYKLGGRIESTTNARGYTTSFDRTPTSASITDALDRTTTTHLSPYGLATGTTFDDESETSSSYDGTTRLDNSQSFPLGFTDESGREREYGYDTHSGLEQAADLAGNDWSYTYAPTIGSDISYDVESGAVSLNASDAYGFGEGGGSEYRDVGTLSDPHGAMSSAFGRALASVTSPLGEVTTYHRNTAGRLDLITYPDGGEREITYDSRGLPVTTVLPQGTTVHRSFDAAFRETQRTTSTAETRTMTYGPMDRVETMTDATGTTTYHYDTAGRFTGMTYPHGGSVVYTRDKLSRVTDVRVKTTASATELVTHYTYDENGNLETITDPNAGVTTYVYDEVDRLVSRTLPNDVTTTYTYDARDRVLSVVHTGLMSNVLASVTYVRSPSGEPTRVTREDGSYVVLTYDDALRLETESYYDDEDNLLNAIEYEYDADGNRVGKVALVGGAEVYDYEDGFQLSTVTKGSVVDEFEYDGGGRVTGIERGGVETTLQWNVDDKITRVLEDDVEVAEYSYDGAGRRVASEIGGVSKRYLVAPNVGDGYETPQAVTESDGDLIAMYIFAGEHPIAKISAGGAIEYYLQDSMGSVIAKSDDAGEISATVKYDSFGDVTGTSGTAASASNVGGDFRLHGMWLDEVSGLYHVRARTYDAATGRFLSRDPVDGDIQQPETYGTYLFNRNNPWVWIDPTGESTFTLNEMNVLLIVGAAIAATASASYAISLLRARGSSLTVSQRRVTTQSGPESDEDPDDQPTPLPFPIPWPRSNDLDQGGCNGLPDCSEFTLLNPDYRFKNFGTAKTAIASAYRTLRASDITTPSDGRARTGPCAQKPGSEHWTALYRGTHVGSIAKCECCQTNRDGSRTPSCRYRIFDPHERYVD